MVAERATIEHFCLDRIMNAIVKATETVKLFEGVGNMKNVLGKLAMTRYTYKG